MLRELIDREGKVTWSYQKCLGFGHWINDRETDILVKKITVNKNTDAEVSITGSFEFEKHRLIRGG